MVTGGPDGLGRRRAVSESRINAEVVSVGGPGNLLGHLERMAVA